MDLSIPPEGGNQDRGSVILGVTWTLTLIALVFVSLRIFTRVKLVQKIWWDDWLAVFAIACALPLPIIWIFYVQGGGSRHLYYLSAQQRVQSIKLNWISQPFGIMAIGIAKASVAFSILRFQSPNKWRTRVLYFIALSITLLSILNCILTFVQCTPVRALWSPELAATAKCWAPDVFTYYAIAQNSYSVSLDFILVFISTTIIWNLKLSLTRRIQLAALLGTGIVDGVLGIIKTTTLTAQSARSDYTWNTYPLFMWTVGELHGIIIGCCLPTLRPLYLIIFKRPGREAYISKSKQARLYSFKDSLPLSHNSDTRQAYTASTPSDEDVSVPGIKHRVDVDVSFSPGRQAHESSWAAKPGNARSTYYAV